MMYHPIKSGCKRISSSADIRSNEPSLWPWNWKQQTNLLAWHFGPWCCITIQSWLQTVQLLWRYCSGQHSLEFLTFFCDLDLDHNRAIFSQDNPPYDNVLSNQVWLQMYQQFKRSSRNSHILIIWALAVTFTLKIATTTTKLMTLWLMMLYHHTKSGNKMFCDSEIFKHSLTFWIYNVTLTSNTVLPFFHRTLQRMLYYQIKFGCKLTSSSEDTT